MKKILKYILICLSLITIVAITFAHECILLAYKFNVTKGDTLELHLFIADGFNIQLERPFQKKSILRFNLITQNGKIDLLSNSQDGQLPILKRVVDFNGLGLLFMERNYAKIILANDKFMNYLKEDHIENIRINKESGKKEQRERYTRYIKCLVQSNSIDRDTLFKTIVNQNLEIVLLSNPYNLQIGDKLKVQVLFMGRPLTNKMIMARNRTGSQPSTMQTSRTDNNGISSFTINRKGDWFIHTTHMISCPDPSDADWESYWATYSFGTKD